MFINRHHHFHHWGQNNLAPAPQIAHTPCCSIEPGRRLPSLALPERFFSFVWVSFFPTPTQKKESGLAMRDYSSPGN